jgi:hypothetical protein
VDLLAMSIYTLSPLERILRGLDEEGRYLDLEKGNSGVVLMKRGDVVVMLELCGWEGILSNAMLLFLDDMCTVSA